MRPGMPGARFADDVARNATSLLPPWQPWRDQMTALAFLIPVSIILGGLGLAVFFWAFRTGQYEDVAGASLRIFMDDEDKPL